MGACNHELPLGIPYVGIALGNGYGWVGGGNAGRELPGLAWSLRRSVMEVDSPQFTLMVILYYLYILLPFAASFALGYRPMRVFGRLLTKGAAMGNTDTLAPLASMAGTAVGFLFAGFCGFDRFGLAPDRVRDIWMSSGQSFSFELAQHLFSGVLGWHLR